MGVCPSEAYLEVMQPDSETFPMAKTHPFFFFPSLYLGGPLKRTWHYKSSEKRRRRKRKGILLLHSLKEVYPLGSLGRAGKLSHMAKGHLGFIGSSCLLTTPCGQNSEMFPQARVSEHHPDVFLVHPFTR